MTDKKNWGSTVLGWFVVKNERDEMSSLSQADGSVEAVEGAAVPEPAGQGDVGTPALAASAFAGAIPDAPGGKIDFDAVFVAAGIDPEEQGRVSKAAELLGALPAATEPAVKKQIVEASLKAFGVPIDKIIEAGVEEIQALEAYIRAGATDTQKVLAESSQRIASLEQEIQQIKQVVEERGQEQQAVIKSCNERKLDVQRVLEFFGQEAVARVVRESPKLIDPNEAQSASRS